MPSRIIFLSSGVSSSECTATACCTAASTSSSSESAAIPTVQFISLGTSPQSTYFRAIRLLIRNAGRALVVGQPLEQRGRVDLLLDVHELDRLPSTSSRHDST